MTPGELVQVGLSVLRTYISATGAVLAQIGDAVSNTVETDRVAWFQHVGFNSRPSKAAAGKQACDAILLRGHQFDAVIASRDLRGLALAALLKEGETCVYSAGVDGTGQARTLWKSDGSITHFTTSNNTDTGKSVYARTKPDGFEWVAPWGRMTFDEMGWRILHKSGASIELGGIYGLPAPMDQLTTYIRMQAATITKNASTTSTGPAGAPQVPLASSDAATIMLGSLQAQMNTLAAGLAAVAAAVSSTPTAAVAAATPVVSAISAASAQNATTALLLPTTTTGTV